MVVMKRSALAVDWAASLAVPTSTNASRRSRAHSCGDERVSRENGGLKGKREGIGLIAMVVVLGRAG